MGYLIVLGIITTVTILDFYNQEMQSDEEQRPSIEVEV